MDWAALTSRALEALQTASEQLREYGSDFVVGLNAVVQWLDLDLSAATLTKHAVLLLLIWILLWALGLIYRGEIQNKDLLVDVIDNEKAGYGEHDVLFTRLTMDTRSENIPALVTVENRFSFLGEDPPKKHRTIAFRRVMRLRMQPKKTSDLPHDKFAFAQNIANELRNAAEVGRRNEIRRKDRTIARSLTRLFGKQPKPIEASAGQYVVRIQFSRSFFTLPGFLLFQHPDPEVKATGWLTLLTSLFAIITNLLFISAADNTRSSEADSTSRVPVVRSIQPPN